MLSVSIKKLQQRRMKEP